MGCTINIQTGYKESEIVHTMKIDPYKHEERYLKWRKSSEKGISEVNKTNSDLILRYLDNMENEINNSGRDYLIPK